MLVVKFNRYLLTTNGLEKGWDPGKLWKRPGNLYELHSTSSDQGFDTCWL